MSFKFFGVPVCDVTREVQTRPAFRGNRLRTHHEVGKFIIREGTGGSRLKYRGMGLPIIGSNSEGLIDNNIVIFLKEIISNGANLIIPEFGWGNNTIAEADVTQNYSSTAGETISVFQVSVYKITNSDSELSYLATSKPLLLVAFIAKMLEGKKEIIFNMFRVNSKSDWMNLILSENILDKKDMSTMFETILHYRIPLLKFLTRMRSDEIFITLDTIVCADSFFDTIEARINDVEEIKEKLGYQKRSCPGLFDGKTLTLESDHYTIRQIGPINLLFWSLISVSVIVYVLSVVFDWFNERPNQLKRIVEPLAILAAVDVTILGAWKVIAGRESVIRQALLFYKEVRTSEDLSSILHPTSLGEIDVATIIPEKHKSLNLCFLGENNLKGHIKCSIPLTSNKKYKWVKAIDIRETIGKSESSYPNSHTIVVSILNSGNFGRDMLKICKIHERGRWIANVENLQPYEYWSALTTGRRLSIAIGGNDHDVAAALV